MDFDWLSLIGTPIAWIATAVCFFTAWITYKFLHEEPGTRRRFWRNLIIGTMIFGGVASGLANISAARLRATISDLQQTLANTVAQDRNIDALLLGQVKILKGQSAEIRLAKRQIRDLGTENSALTQQLASAASAAAQAKQRATALANTVEATTAWTNAILSKAEADARVANVRAAEAEARAVHAEAKAGAYHLPASVAQRITATLNQFGSGTIGIACDAGLEVTCADLYQAAKQSHWRAGVTYSATIFAPGAFDAPTNESPFDGLILWYREPYRKVAMALADVLRTANFTVATRLTPNNPGESDLGISLLFVGDVRRP